MFLHRCPPPPVDSPGVLLSVLSVLSLSVGADTPAGFQLARAAVSTPPPSATRARSRTIYLNRHGVTVMPGANDSEHDRSSVTNQLAHIPAWEVSPQIWRDTVTCLETMFAPFDVTITETDPGAVPHIEAVFGGSGDLLGLPARIGGVSPMSTSCAVIESSMVFTFTSVIPQSAQVACEIQAQEIAHSFGLDHELLAADPMTYLRFAGERAFQDELASCGETAARPCGISGSVCRDKQNSYTLLLERLGPAGAGDLEPPLVDISSPSDGALVDPGFEVRVTASDDVGVTDASISIDGEPAGAISTAPWRFTTAATLAPGHHTITIVVTDGIHEQTEEIGVTVRGELRDGGDDPAILGCHTTGGDGSILVGLAAVLVVRRRRSAPAPRR